MKRVQFIAFRASAAWATGPQVHLGDYDGAWDAEQGIREFQSQYEDAGKC